MRDMLKLSAILFCGYFVSWWCLAIGQPLSDIANQQPIGAYRIYQKTHFQCAGRPSGYYADVETGCQVYHMCDGLGRQFSYSCPNTTLFQQRMLICDHWYMVNCSRAESNYDANLLIGQRDKPFVTDQENELRTPRPDLLDRPYAADYAGESYRNQYKPIESSPNSLDSDFDQRPDEPFVQRKQAYTFGTYWNTQHPGQVQTTVPPATPRPQRLSINADLLPPFQSQHQQHAGEDPSIAHDLTLSSSQDSRRSEPESNFINSIPTQKPAIRKPSTLFTPPHSQPQYNREQQQHTLQPATQSPGTPKSSAFTQQVTDSSTNTYPTTLLDNTPKPFVRNQPPKSPAHIRPGGNRGQTKYTGDRRTSTTLADSGRILTRPSTFATFPQSPSTASTAQPTVAPSANQPFNDLLPPFDRATVYDDATTQGPPIYSQWKIPSSGLVPPLQFGQTVRSKPNQLFADDRKTFKVPASSVPISALRQPANGLQPPRFEAPTTESPSTQRRSDSVQLNDAVRKSNFPQTTPSFPLHVPTATEPTNINPLQQHQLVQQHQKAPTPRSVPPTPNAIEALHIGAASARDPHYVELKKLLLIPDYTFPLETDSVAREKYVRNDSVNSFLVKIPADVNAAPVDPTVATSATGANDEASAVTSTNRTRRTPAWYGENAACPECHPAFVKGASCRPCIKFRR